MLRAVKGTRRIYVIRGTEEWVVPYWITKRGNLAWRIGETLYVKRPDGFTMMLEDGEWLPADAHTPAKAPTPRPPEPEAHIRRFEFPDTL